VASELFVVGVSWRTAPVSLRERLAFTNDELSDALLELTSLPTIDEAMIISTCNRVEIYGATPRAAAASTADTATAEALSFLARVRSVSGDELSGATYERVDREAVQHIFRVASALDSMVIGESQILGQVKEAFGSAMHAGVVGPLLGRCLERAFGVAKKVRTETAIARGAANVSSVAVELAGQVFGDLAGRHVLVIGAGKMSALAARHLRRAGAASIRITNRSAQRAKDLAEEIEGVAHEWDELPQLLAGADVVISSTASKTPVLNRPLLKKALKKRRYRPMVIVDIAVPRDVDPAVAKLDGIYLFDVDDLRRVVDNNLRERSKEASQADRIVQIEMAAFDDWLRAQRVVPTIRSLRSHFAGVARTETDKILKLLEREHTPKERERAIRRLGDSIVNKLLHQPLITLKDPERDVEALVHAAEALFRLEGEQDEEDEEDAGLGAPVEASSEPRGRS